MFLIRDGNSYFFQNILCLIDGMGDAYLKGLCLMFLPNVLGATFIPGATCIPESRVGVKIKCDCSGLVSNSISE